MHFILQGRVSLDGKRIEPQNHRYIAINRRFLEIYPEKSSDRYFSKKYHVDTFRHTIYRNIFLLVLDWLCFHPLSLSLASHLHLQ